MDYFLVRHGEARSENEDGLRILTPRGKKEVKAVAQLLLERGVSIQRIFHSEKLRAKETAEILACHLLPSGGVSEIKGLGPNDNPMMAKTKLENAKNPIMLVGHLPHLGRLTSALVTGDSGREVINLPVASVMCLSRKKNVWNIKWTLGKCS